ncbi:MAG TPA: hypothetical protein VKM72_10860 [Thermoanaerobaculia bacterium]|nr:hypothetical protein [Thermoanaerobaculia bacterium]
MSSLPPNPLLRRLAPEALGFFLLAALHLALAAPMRGPMLFGDETAHLGIARFLAGDAPYPTMTSPAMGFVAFYHFGYPLLLAPVSRLSDDPLTVYRTALAINSFLLAALFPLLASFSRRVFGLAPADAALAGIAASLYPAFLLQSNLTWAESLLAPLVVGVILVFSRLVERPGFGTACGLGLAAAFAYATHARMLGLVPLVLLALAVLWKRGLLRTGPALAGALTTVAGFGIVRAVNGLVAAELWAGNRELLKASDLAARLIDPVSLSKAFLSLAGQLWYLSVASAGLFLLGLWFLARIALRREEIPVRRLTALFTLAVATVLIGTSALFVIQFGRADLAIYGRYAESFLGPFLAAGLAGLYQAAARRRLPVAAALAAIPCALAALLIAWHGGAVFQRVYNELNILGIEHLILLVGGMRMLRLTAVGAVAILAVYAAGSLRPRAAAALAGALFLAGSLYTYDRWVLGANHMGNDATSLPRAVEALGVEEVAYDASAFTIRGFYGYQFWLDDVRFTFFQGARERPPRELVISSKSFGQSHPGARMIFPERYSEHALWVMPGSLQQRLEREGKLVSLNPLGPLPDAACRSAVAWVGGEDRLKLRPGAARPLQIRVEHRGRGAVWVPNDALDSPWGTVRLGARWFREGESAPVEEGGQRGDLPYALLPGEAAEVRIAIEARGAGGAPLGAGSYLVEIGPVQEGVRWFRDVGDPPLRIPVEISWP